MIFFPYSWHLDNEPEKHIKIWIFGLTAKNKSICVIINDFKPYIYVELPTNIQWTNVKAKMVANKIDFLCGKKVRNDGTILQGFAPEKKELIYKKKLYHASLTNQTFPFLKLTFSSSDSIRKFTWKIKRKINVTGLPSLKLKSHEHNANPILQLISSQDIPTAGWIEFSARKVKERETYCRYEYIVKSKNLKRYKSDLIPQPLILSMDIEVNSSNPSTMPDAEKPGDKVFQISCVLFRNGSNNYQKFLLTLGEPNPDKVGKDIEIIMYNTEADLLIGYSDFILEKGPQLIIGYNILGFDIPYMITRSKYQRIIYDFDQQGFVKHQHASEKLIKWSSSAYKNQEFQYLDAYGRLFVDLLPLIKRDYKLNRYNLKTVSTHFLGETKDPLTPKGIFKCYRLGFGKGGIWNGTKKGMKALAIVGKYCVQDSLLVVKLFNLLQTWVGLTEMAKTCNVPIFYLYTQGQQIKVFAQVYKKCLEENIVVEYDGYQVKDDEYYTGAHVFDPIPGMYDKVVPFDFSSLYPTTIIAYNIDYSTLAMDPAIPDEVCHIIEWEDHIGCEHDTTKRTTKPPHIMCTSRRYRFLKKPMGIIPALLTNLLNARAKTKKQMKEIKAQLLKSKKPELQILLTMLDKRQASYKVSANSMYGAMGVRRGFLPFLPGAMCTTAMGRKSLEKAAHILQKQFKGKLIYGDSVTGDTPLLVKCNDNIFIMYIEDLGDKWTEYPQFKLEHNAKQQTITNYKVWTSTGWSKIRRVIKHQTCKQIYRINTHCGCVDVTEDHSLLSDTHRQIKPKNLELQVTKLLHNYPVFSERGEKLEILLNYNISRTIYEKEAFIMGLFFADGSCGKYTYDKSVKYSWAINKQNRKLLELCQTYMTELYGYKFKILGTMKSSHVLKLVPVGSIKFFYKKFRPIFYDKNKLKIIPNFILNAVKNIRLHFFMGYYNGDKCINTRVKNIRFSNKGKLGSAQLYYLTKSLGYNTSVQIRQDKLDIYRISCTTNKFRKHPHIVKKIIKLKKVNEFVYDLETEQGNFQAGIGEIIVKNTDSCYIQFPHLETAKEIWDYSVKVEDDISNLFPQPMRLAFEEKIYWKFFILTKKRYMALWCLQDGVISDQIFKRGVLIARRDNSKFIREIYKEVVMKVLYSKSQKEVVEHIITGFNQLCSSYFNYKDFIVTKSIGELSNYKIRELLPDEKKRLKRMKDLKIYCYDEVEYLKWMLKGLIYKKHKNNDKRAEKECKKIDKMSNIEIRTEPYKFDKLGFIKWLEEDPAGQIYRLKCLPAHVQLAEKMRTRGVRVDVGTRLEYLITTNGGPKARQYEKIEDPAYQQHHSNLIKIDYLYYLHLLINPLDQVLKVRYGMEDFVKMQYKLRMQKYKFQKEIKNYFSPTITFL